MHSFGSLAEPTDRPRCLPVCLSVAKQQLAIENLFSGFKAELADRLVPELDAALPKQ